jgi:hypothetical protein
VTKLQTAHFTDLAPYWYISSIMQFPQFTCATWFASRARLTVWQQEHWTLVAPRMYIKSVWHPPHTNCAISVPGGGTAVTALQTAQQTEVAPTGYIRRFLQPEHTNWLCPLVLPTNLKLFLFIFLTKKSTFKWIMNTCEINKCGSGKIIEQFFPMKSKTNWESENIWFFQVCMTKNNLV